jgi:hypothetical protein
MDFRLYLSAHYERQKLGKVVNVSLYIYINQGVGWKGWNFIIPFVGKRLILPYFYFLKQCGTEIMEVSCAWFVT